jgi:hypothetical protein
VPRRRRRTPGWPSSPAPTPSDPAGILPPLFLVPGAARRHDGSNRVPAVGFVRGAGRGFVRPAGPWLRFVRIAGTGFVREPPLPISVLERNSLQNSMLVHSLRPTISVKLGSFGAARGFVRVTPRVRPARRSWVRSGDFGWRPGSVRLAGPGFVRGPPLPSPVLEPNSLQNSMLVRDLRPVDPGGIGFVRRRSWVRSGDAPGPSGAPRLGSFG